MPPDTAPPALTSLHLSPRPETARAQELLPTNQPKPRDAGWAQGSSPHRPPELQGSHARLGNTGPRRGAETGAAAAGSRHGCTGVSRERVELRLAGSSAGQAGLPRAPGSADEPLSHTQARVQHQHSTAQRAHGRMGTGHPCAPQTGQASAHPAPEATSDKPAGAAPPGPSTGQRWAAGAPEAARLRCHDP